MATLPPAVSENRTQTHNAHGGRHPPSPYLLPPG
jgi:hypothetical protein